MNTAAFPHLRQAVITTECASADALKHLLQLHSAIFLNLGLGKKNWLAVADEIRRGRCNVQSLILALSTVQGAISDATEAVKAVAGAIGMDRNLEHLTLEVEDGFTDEAGVALAEALAVNINMRKITLSVDSFLCHEQYTATLGASAYEALSAMLRVNTSLVLKLPPFETDGTNERLCESRK